MKKKGPYTSPAAVEAAIKTAALRAWELEPTQSISDRIRMEYYNRFLCRIFGSRSAERWLLKGGSGLLARVSSARVTQDIDLLRSMSEVDPALEELQGLAAIDIGDFFEFTHLDHAYIVPQKQQAYTAGCQVRFGVSIGAKQRGILNIDLVTNSLVTDTIDIVRPATALKLPRLPSAPYRLYPVVDQIADKVCATHSVFQERTSSRQKDLVDLVILAATQRIDANKLERAINLEARIRRLTLPPTFRAPKSWGPKYEKLASRIPACRNHTTIDAAKSLMASFIDPVLRGSARGKVWDYPRQTWRTPRTASATAGRPYDPRAPRLPGAALGMNRPGQSGRGLCR